MEVLVKVGTVTPDQKYYQYGDIVAAMSAVQIEYCHAEMACHVDKAGFNGVGLRDVDSLLYRYMEKTSKYKFIRLNSNEVKRINLLTVEEDIISTTPNADGEAINVAQFLRRRLVNKRHKIFGGRQGQEIWYGGNAPRDRDHSDVLWNEIEAHSDNLKANCCNWPFTPLEKSGFLPLNCCGHKHGEVVEVSDGTCGERASSVKVEGEPDEDGRSTQVMVAKKKWQIPYWDLAVELGIDVSEVRDKDKQVDARSSGDKHDWNHMDDVHVDKVAAGIVTL